MAVRGPDGRGLWLADDGRIDRAAPRPHHHALQRREPHGRVHALAVLPDLVVDMRAGGDACRT